MGKYQKWWDSLSPQMQTYLKNQPIWHDSDMFKAALFGGIVGFIIGVIVAWH